MSLKEYRAKRDFTKSPEPRGDDATATTRTRGGPPPRFFCVQKHLATALHYDFRLEHNGVLLSWAVPKGPSLDPTVKRLAMHVEDHPIEYGTFEGVIPDGYGAGVVMLWDQGTWTPEVEDVDAALAKGDLKLTLDGYKLKGSWVLVRTRGWGGGGGGRGGDGGAGRSWLLIKHRDDWSGPIDIATFAPLSVKSEGTFRDILTQGAPDLWHSNRAAAGKAPTGDAALLKIVEKVIALEEEEGTAAAGGEASASAGAASTTATTTRTKSKTKTTNKTTTTSEKSKARTAKADAGARANADADADVDVDVDVEAATDAKAAAVAAADAGADADAETADAPRVKTAGRSGAKGAAKTGAARSGGPAASASRSRAASAAAATKGADEGTRPTRARKTGSPRTTEPPRAVKKR